VSIIKNFEGHRIRSIDTRTEKNSGSKKGTMAASKVTTDQCTNTIAPVFWKHCRSRVSNWTPQELFYGHTVSNWKLTNRKYILQHVIDSKLRQTSFPYQQKPTRKSPELYEDSNSSTKQTMFPVDSTTIIYDKQLLS